MLHQLQSPKNRQIPEGDYAFCANRDCNIGYFSASGHMPKSDLRAFQPGQQAMLCHCFDISEASYSHALQGGTAIKAFVCEQTQANSALANPETPQDAAAW